MMSDGSWSFMLGELEVTQKEPHLLWGLFLCVLLIVPVLRSSAWISRPSRWISLAIRVCLLVSLVLAASMISIVVPSDRVCVSVLLDVSDSMPDEALQTGQSLARALTQQKRERDTVSIIVWGGGARDVSRAFSRGELKVARELRAEVDRQATDLSSALRLAHANFSDDCSSRIVLVSDEKETRGDAGAAFDALLDELKTQGRPPPYFAQVRVEGDRMSDTGVVDFELPEQIRILEPFDFRVRVRATAPAVGRLALRSVSPSGEETVIERPLDVPEGDTSVRFSITPESAGELALEARWISTNPERFVENDVARIVTTILGPPEILLVDSEPAESSALSSALGAQRYEVRTVRPGGVPQRAEDLERYAFVILSDVQRSSLAPKAEQALVEMVRSGGGLLVASGMRSRGSFEGSALERILPLHAEGRNQERSAGVAMVLVIDRSGSMSGAPLEMAKAACRATLGTLEATDLLEVIAFDGKPSRAVPMQPVRLRASMDVSLARIQPGGGTEILASLDMAYQDLARVRARKKHIVLLTDGNADTDGIYEVASAAFADGITVTSVGLGSGVNEALLRSIAEAGGGRFHGVSDPNALPRIFVRETELAMQEDATEELFSLAVLEDAEFFKGTGIRGAPPLRGFEPMRVAPSPARALLALDTGDPLLASMPVGLGKTLVWASDLKGGWGREFLRWPGLPKVMGQLVRAHQRSDDREVWPLAVSFREGRLVATFDAPLDGERFDNSVVSVMTAFGADKAPGEGEVRYEAPFELKGPGHYEAALELPKIGTYWLRASHHSRSRDVRARSFQAVAHPYPEEYVDVRRDNGDAPSIVALGRPLGSDVSALLRPGQDGARTRIDLRDSLLSAAALLLVLDIFVRRRGARSPRVRAGAPGPKPE